MLTAFRILSNARTSGFTHNPIAVSEVVAYATAFGYAPADDLDEFLRFIQAMDRAWLKHHAPKTDKEPTERGELGGGPAGKGRERKRKRGR